MAIGHKRVHREEPGRVGHVPHPLLLVEELLDNGDVLLPVGHLRCGPELPRLFPPLSRDLLNRIIGCHHRDPRLSIHASRRYQIRIPLATASSSRRSYVTQILYRGRSRSSLYPPSIITMHQFLRGGAQPTVRRVNLLDVFTRHLKTYYGSGMICGA